MFCSPLYGEPFQAELRALPVVPLGIEMDGEVR